MDNMNTFLVTGGDGFIGRHIIKNIDGVSYDILSGLDILDKETLKKFASNTKGIFHCAAKISVPESFYKSDIYFETNVTGTKTVIEIAKELRIPIVFSSSAAVYGEYLIPVNENMLLSPQSPYAENKKDGELLLKSEPVPSIVLRYFNVYGPGQSPEYAGAISLFIKRALLGDDIVIFGDGKQTRDFVYVDDVAEANRCAMEYVNTKEIGHYSVYNIGSGESVTIQELAEKIIALTQSSSKITYQNTRTGDIRYSVANISKAQKILGWHPRTNLDEGLKKTIDALKVI